MVPELRLHAKRYTRRVYSRYLCNRTEVAECFLRNIASAWIDKGFGCVVVDVRYERDEERQRASENRRTAQLV